jgi:hypothetical protein
MSNETSRYACDLLRAALDLLDDESSLAAMAMISGAINVLERNTVAVETRSGADTTHILGMPGTAFACQGRA